MSFIIRTFVLFSNGERAGDETLGVYTPTCFKKKVCLKKLLKLYY